MKLIVASMIFLSGIFLTGCSENELSQSNADQSDSTTNTRDDGFKKSSRKSYTVGSIKDTEEK